MGRRIRAALRAGAGQRRCRCPEDGSGRRADEGEGLMNTEHVDGTLASYSDWAFTSSIVVLVGALLLLAFELAYARSRNAEERELVTAGAAPDSAPPRDRGRAPPGIVVDAPPRPFDERVGRAGLGLVYLGMGLLLACIVLRGLATMRAPWGNMYEFINL